VLYSFIKILGFLKYIFFSAWRRLSERKENRESPGEAGG
jgi:hypothetical protein